MHMVTLFRPDIFVFFLFLAPTFLGTVDHMPTGEIATIKNDRVPTSKNSLGGVERYEWDETYLLYIVLLLSIFSL